MKFEQEVNNALRSLGYSQANAETIAKTMAPKLNSACNLLQQVLDKNIGIFTADFRYDGNNNAEQILMDLISQDCEFFINSFKDNLDGLNRFIRLARENLADNSALYLLPTEASIIASVLLNDDDFDAVVSLLEMAFTTFSSDYADKLKQVSETVFYTTVYSYCLGVHNRT